jgi:lipopolysaccharide/colanic/teichoic acid biosynthesis glycosyltransferase
MSGLCIVILLLLRTIPFAGLEEFYYLLIALSVKSWLVTAQFRVGLRSLSYHTYRFAAVPATAGILVLALASAMRVPSSPVAVLVFAAAWTLWILAVRHTLRRHSPPLRTMCIGSGDFCSELGNHRQFAIKQLTTAPSDYDGWDLVVVEDLALSDPEWQRWLIHADLAGLRIVTAPAAREVLTGRVPLESLDAALATGMFKRERTYLFWKRFLDLSIIAVTAPLIALTCLLVALVLLVDSGRPILFSQRRVGKDGKSFRIYKFRTMRTDAESGGPAFASHGDPRVTCVGAFLRKFRLDELPQFWNVLRGDMSIIGPRPEQLDFVTEFCEAIPLYEVRHWVPPGITGWAQVRHGYAAGSEETRVKLSYDLYYVKYCSLALDLSIVFRTCQTILTGFGSR